MSAAMIRRGLGLARPMVNYQASREVATMKATKVGLDSAKNILKYMQSIDYRKFAKELAPPTPFEIKDGIKEGFRLIRSSNWRNTTVREASLNTLVTIEVVCWFFVGEVIGKGTLIGYQV